jgi:hypothetical protein
MIKPTESSFPIVDSWSKLNNSKHSPQQQTHKTELPKFDKPRKITNPEINNTNNQKTEQEIKSFWDSFDLNDLIRYDSNVNQNIDKKETNADQTLRNNLNGLVLSDKSKEEIVEPICK